MHEHQFGIAAPFGPETERAKEILNELDRNLLRTIREQGGMDAYLTSHPELHDSFNSQNHDLCCMDERTASGSLSTPGSGILIEGEEAQNAYAERLKAAGIEGVYSHNECGAAILYAKEHGIEDANQAAVAYAQDLAQRLGVAYKGHLKASGVHPGRVVYYDTTGSINRGSPVWQEKMPTGYAISRNVLSEQEAQDALILAVKIAFGDAGYGPTAFTQSDPLSLIYVARPSETVPDSKTSLEQELLKAYERIEREIPEAKGKIDLQGFTAPIQSQELAKEAA